MTGSFVDKALEGLAYAARPLVAAGDFTGRLGRAPFAAAVLLAAGLLAAARALDWFVFGAMPGAVPAYFVGLCGIGLSVPLAAIGVRRLHGTGRSGRWMLLLLVPLPGWPILAAWWLQPDRRRRATVDGPALPGHSSIGPRSRSSR